MKPADVVDMFNSFFRVTVRVVEEHGGMVNKFLGDGFMALFGAEHSTTNHADAAVQAGREILLSVQTLNREFEARGREPIRIGVGLHSGPAIIGSIGSPQRLEFTAMGNTVNIASRIEKLSKVVGRPMLLTAEVQARLTIQFPLERLPPQQVRGIDEPVTVFAWQP
jgi:adenylate cyclase